MVRRAPGALGTVTTLVAVATLAACASSGGGTPVAVTGTDSACTAAPATAPAGTVTFTFTNQASQVSELYVLRPDGSTVAEVENVTAGVPRKLTADLAEGPYVLACKPGQSGDGIRGNFTVTKGSGGQSAGSTAAPSASADIQAVNYSYQGVPASLPAGATVRLTLHNEGTVEHELEVLAPDGTSLGEVGPTKPGASGSVTVTLGPAGTYRFVCGISGHEALGMHADLTVR
jgi:uncharacterized cupredoxin-like copper-binding protein